MNKKHLVDEVLLQMVSGTITKREITEALTHAFDLIREVAHKEPVTISGFGTFKVATRAAKMGRNPKTGEVVNIPERKAVVFKRGK